MPSVEQLLTLWLALMTLLQALLLWKYVSRLRDSQGANKGGSTYPPVVAILCLRGADPFLRDCILRLLSCDYPQLRVRVVVDSASDPALPMVRGVLAERNDPRAELMVLRERREFCSGKVSGLLFATENLPPDCEVVAWIDGDSLLHSSAIHELVNGLNDPTVGAVSGNRWYFPTNASLSGLTRMSWNAFAVPTMNMFGIMWGGCMAARASDMKDSRLRNKLANSFIEDSAVASFVHATGRKTRMLGTCILLNRESTSLKDYYRFSTRQLFTVRIDHSNWKWLAIHMLALNATLLLTVLLILTQLVVAGPGSVSSNPITAGYLVLLSTTVSAIPIGHYFVRRTTINRGEQFPRMTLAQILVVGLTLLITNQLNLVSTIHCFFIKKLTWRRITYRFGVHPKCQVVESNPLENDVNIAHSVI